jgi:2-aminoadipate transaminase
MVCCGLLIPPVNPRLESPIYRQLYEHIRNQIERGLLVKGDRLPPTRELAIQIGLNRTTVSAAYALLEAEGLITGHVGRGSYVNYTAPSREAAPEEFISFASSRPAESDFPIAEIQSAVREVTASPELGSILQLGSPAGYAPLRRHLLRDSGATSEDDVLVTSGCQQALDLVQRVFAAAGETVLVEDPVYHGIRNVFSRPGIRLVGVRMSATGIDVEQLGRLLVSERPRLLVVTPEFQNPTGTTVPLAARRAIVRLARESGTIVIENDIYRDLRYEGDPLPTLKELDGSGNVILVRSFSKIAFPGLRVGWTVGPAALISRLTEARQWCDLHTDQLSQAILLRFAESGRLAAHCERMRAAGRERLRAMFSACEEHLPEGAEFTRPEGGMNVWVRLPQPLDASELVTAAEREQVSYLPGRRFAVSHHEAGTLRLSFGALSPEQIETGLARLGRVFSEVRHLAAAPAVV